MPNGIYFSPEDEPDGRRGCTVLVVVTTRRVVVLFDLLADRLVVQREQAVANF